MIAYLSGTVLFKEDARLVVDAHGVGYEVFVPFSTALEVPDGASVALHIQTVVREDAFQLYGFRDRDEKSLFLLLTGVKGVGPKLALALLSAMPPAELVKAIREEAITRLCKVNGVGKKTAERLCLELKDKVIAFLAVPSGRATRTMAAGETRVTGVPGDAVSALINLGYPRGRAEAAIQAAAEELPGAALEELVKRGLSALARAT